jgi:hypothetical protein
MISFLLSVLFLNSSTYFLLFQLGCSNSEGKTVPETGAAAAAKAAWTFGTAEEGTSSNR